MAEYVIIVHDWNLAPRECPVVGQYVEWLDPTISPASGKTMFGFTDDPAKAKKFANAGEAWSFWATPLIDENGAVRLRLDGHPEKPLTAFTVAIEPLKETDSAYPEA